MSVSPHTLSKLNTILLALLAFLFSQLYYTIIADHEKIAGHETRITVLESKAMRTTSKEPKMPCLTLFGAMLPKDIQVEGE